MGALSVGLGVGRQVAESDSESGPVESSPAGEFEASPTAPPLSTFPRRNRDLFKYLLTTFQAMLPPEKAAQFAVIAEELERSIQDNCQVCSVSHQAAGLEMPRDPRRSRFLLRLVVGRVSHLFAGDKAIMPRSLIEGLDRYLKKAFGSVIYEELNVEADQLLYRLNVDDDREIWQRIRENPHWQRFVDTIFIRILFRFENFTNGKKTFMSIVSMTMEDISRFTFKDDHFYLVFEALFVELWQGLEQEEQRIRWDFLFGDGTSKRIQAILSLGLVRWMKKKDRIVLGSGRVIAKK